MSYDQSYKQTNRDYYLIFKIDFIVQIQKKNNKIKNDFAFKNFKLILQEKSRMFLKLS